MVNSYLMVSGFPPISAYFPLLISNSLKNKVRLWEQAVKHNLWLLLKLEFSLASGTRKSSIKHLPTINLFPMQRIIFFMKFTVILTSYDYISRSAKETSSSPINSYYCFTSKKSQEKYRHYYSY